jgi:hypothetical protein
LTCFCLFCNLPTLNRIELNLIHMKLSVEQLADLSKIARYFEKIEEMAGHMGLEVDALLEGVRQQNAAVYVSLKKNISAVASMRRNILTGRSNGSLPVGTPAARLTVIVNEDRFRS